MANTSVAIEQGIKDKLDQLCARNKRTVKAQMELLIEEAWYIEIGQPEGVQPQPAQPQPAQAEKEA